MRSPLRARLILPTLLTATMLLLPSVGALAADRPPPAAAVNSERERPAAESSGSDNSREASDTTRPNQQRDTAAQSRDDGARPDEQRDAVAQSRDDGGRPDEQRDTVAQSKDDRDARGSNGAEQGNATSDPDDDSRGPDRSNGGVDQPGGEGGVDASDQDANNGCGNDVDFEDDNEGRCGGRNVGHDVENRGNVAAAPEPRDAMHTICHATRSSTNPYVTITISIDGVFNGHLDGGHQDGRDIIPPFTYSDGVTYSQNWPGGQDVFDAGCQAPEGTDEPTDLETDEPVDRGREGSTPDDRGAPARGSRGGSTNADTAPTVIGGSTTVRDVAPPAAVPVEIPGPAPVVPDLSGSPASAAQPVLAATGGASLTLLAASAVALLLGSALLGARRLVPSRARRRSDNALDG